LRTLILTALAVVCIQQFGGDAVPEPNAAQPVRHAPAPAVASTSAVVIPSAAGPAPSLMDALAGPAAPSDLNVMTFNLRYASASTPNSWAQRRPVMRVLLTTERPDLIGTQEGLTAQLRDIDTDLGAGYDYIGMGRNGGTKGEHSAIFFNKARLLPQKSGNFWLSDTPQIPGSVSWGSGAVRMVTWVLFADLETGRHFYAVNTHLDNKSENARRHAAQLIAQRLATFEPLPIVLTGDFNSAAQSSSQVYHLLVDQHGYRDSWTTAPLAARRTRRSTTTSPWCPTAYAPTGSSPHQA
jgi:endonuclease/exonuclease/phosphatase family metal-dependent hydrolase